MTIRVEFRREDVIASALVAAAVLLVYMQTAWFDFTTWDDDVYVTRNPRVREGLSWANVLWSFTTLHAANWHPLTWLSLMLDASLFGNWAGGFHLTSVAWHLAVCLLLYFLLRRLAQDAWRAALVALLFAVHPLHVESVAWVSERKDVLSTAFGLAALHAYVSYAREPSAGRYLLVVAAFVCSLMSKPMLVTLPAVLLLLDFWPLGRMSRASWKSLLLEKVPLVALSVGSAFMTVIAQSASGAVRSLEQMTLVIRLANAVRSYGVYLTKHVWPSELMFLQTFSEPSWPIVALALSALALVSYGAYRLRERVPAVLVGWLWFLGTLVPVIGIVQVGDQPWASRYAYFPSIGLLIAALWLLPSFDFARARGGVLAVAAMVAAGTIAFAARSFVETGYWRNAESLYLRAISLEPGHFVAHAMLAALYADRGDRPRAERHAVQAVQASQGSGIPAQAAMITLSRVFMELGRYDQALRAIDAVERLNPNWAVLHYNRGTLELLRGAPQASLPHLERAIALRPDYSEALNNRGTALARLGRLEEAIDAHRGAIAADPFNFQAHYNLGVALEAAGRPADALSAFLQAARLAPRDLRPKLKAAALLMSFGRRAEANALYQAVLAIDPSNPTARIELSRQ